MGNTIGNRGLQGDPMLPYANVKSYAGADLFLDLEFVDHTMTPVIPTSITLEIDDLTDAIIMFPRTTLNPIGVTGPPLTYPAFAAAMTLQVAGSVMVMSYPSVGSQICQFNFQFTAVDSVTGQPFTSPSVAIVELVAIQTVSGS